MARCQMKLFETIFIAAGEAVTLPVILQAEIQLANRSGVNQALKNLTRELNSPGKFEEASPV